MAASRLVGSYPVIGIRPTIDGRQGYMKVRESLELAMLEDFQLKKLYQKL